MFYRYLQACTLESEKRFKRARRRSSFSGSGPVGQPSIYGIPMPYVDSAPTVEGISSREYFLILSTSTVPVSIYVLSHYS